MHRFTVRVLICFVLYLHYPCWNSFPVTTAWRVLRLRMEERPAIWRVAVIILNK
jgi:hypothetical protein